MDGGGADVSAGARPSPAPPERVRPPWPAVAPVRRSRLGHRLRITVAVVSALVLGLTGTAWGLYRDITAGITTTDVIAGGGDGGAQNILLVGVDSRTDAKGEPLPAEVLGQLRAGDDTGVLNSDTVILLHVPAGGGAAVAFSVPRDTYVDIPGYRRDKINAAYPAMKAESAKELVAAGVRDRDVVEAESAQAGRRALVEAVEGLAGVPVDHYAEINLLGFYNLTTAIGGVDVCLNGPVDEELSGARLPAGPQTISGGDALAFVRQRHELPDGDLSRIRRQQVFLAAVADKILSGGTLTDPAKLGALVEVAQQSLVIDSGWDVLAFAQQASDLAAGNLAFLTIPTIGTETNERGDVVLVDRAEVRAFVERRIDEQDATAEAGATAEPAPPPAAPAARPVVDVHNGSETSGLAAAVAAQLEGFGATRGEVATTAPTRTSVVRHSGPAAGAEAATALAERLGGMAVATGGDVAPGHLLVVLGADFDPAVLERTADAATPAAPASEPITAAGVPCID